MNDRERFLQFVSPEPMSGCWLWTGAVCGYAPHQYGVIGAGKRGLSMIHANRLSWTLFKGTIPKDLWVLHSCDNTYCVNPEHLHLGTPSDNSSERNQRNRHYSTKGIGNGRATLTEADVIAIRSLNGVFTQRKLAKCFNVSHCNIGFILRRKSWVSL